MSFFTMIFIISFLGAIFGRKKPWMGGLPGLLFVPYIFAFSTSVDMTAILTQILFLILLGLAYGFMSAIIFSGLKGRDDRVGQTFISGFGAHHPGGVILSDEELKTLKDKNIKRELFLSY